MAARSGKPRRSMESHSLLSDARGHCIAYDLRVHPSLGMGIFLNIAVFITRSGYLILSSQFIFLCDFRLKISCFSMCSGFHIYHFLFPQILILGDVFIIYISKAYVFD